MTFILFTVKNFESVEQHRQEDNQVSRWGRRQRQVLGRHREDQSLHLLGRSGTGSQLKAWQLFTVTNCCLHSKRANLFSDERVFDEGVAHRQDDLQRFTPLQHAGKSGFASRQNHKSGLVKLLALLWPLFYNYLVTILFYRVSLLRSK